jgi:hypothetical protein
MVCTATACHHVSSRAHTHGAVSAGAYIARVSVCVAAREALYGRWDALEALYRRFDIGIEPFCLHTEDVSVPTEYEHVSSEYIDIHVS